MGVICEPPVECPMGYNWSRPSGACCAGCIADGGPSCVEIACPNQVCPAGYVPGDVTGTGCCYECVPDPLYCTADSECMIADRPRPCCGCPEAISTRAYDEDACWYTPEAPRPIPLECYPMNVCDALCAPCPPPGFAACAQNRCVQVF